MDAAAFLSIVAEYGPWGVVGVLAVWLWKDRERMRGQIEQMNASAKEEYKGQVERLEARTERLEAEIIKLTIQVQQLERERDIATERAKLAEAHIAALEKHNET